ncbi:hypothetical protein CTheo_3318 [Ceratobasidium theobromae]|uniref:T6SS Phospholipase effector Tle1-like catalytic domain-containing protein n=1 Tax=Ceratobasidium theobromae TaxID=1582974 RepID=A0A5N5QQ05_9AGAM|nr:hypothetical protein CTheo_3318 [Ceratobasidium theobromae]
MFASDAGNSVPITQSAPLHGEVNSCSSSPRHPIASLGAVDFGYFRAFLGHPSILIMPPKSKSGRTLILCFDGTSNRYNTDNTNVVKLVSLFDNSSPDRQLIYYQPGIGTYTNPGIFTPVTMKMANLLDLGIAWYVHELYLLSRYPDDWDTTCTGTSELTLLVATSGLWIGTKTEIESAFLGSVAVLTLLGEAAEIPHFPTTHIRLHSALAGMLNKVGLLPAGNHEQVAIAYDLYRSDSKQGYTLSDGFRDTFSRIVPIEFVGVWDSVSSVGILRSHTLPFASSNNIITTFRHAMALDERRTRFSVDPWHAATSPPETLLGRTLASIMGWLSLGSLKSMSDVARDGRASHTTADQLFTNVRDETDVKEVWFAGDHCDVGGGHDIDSEPHSLSHITLRWMVRECQKANVGFIWNESRFAQLKIDISSERLTASDSLTAAASALRDQGRMPVYTEACAPPAAFKDHDEISDAQAPTHDSLKPHWTWPAWFPLGFNLLWWILELAPMRQWWQGQKGEWHRSLRINLGRGRQIRPSAGHEVMFHTSVLAKEQSQRYKPRANMDKGIVPAATPTPSALAHTLSCTLIGRFILENGGTHSTFHIRVVCLAPRANPVPRLPPRATLHICARPSNCPPPPEIIMAKLRTEDDLSRLESGVFHRNTMSEKPAHANGVPRPIEGGRTLIMCFDGTSDRYDQKNTNVVKFVSLLENNFPDKQLIYYQPGIGTYTNPGIFTPISMKIANLLDEAIACWVSTNIPVVQITGGYKWLMNKYQTGDRVCIFGFSRGAYTARALAGMINKVGLLPPGNDEQVTIAYDIYRTDTKEGYTLSDGFRDTFSRVIPIEFVGVWDSVSSVGIIRSHTLPYASCNHIISTFRHAIALDERRAWFVMDPWHLRPIAPSRRFSRFMRHIRRSDPNDQSLLARLLEWLAFGRQKEIADVERGGRPSGVSAERLFTAAPHARPPTNVKEVWFAGCHSDVGGGNVSDTETYSLANITLRWMVRECVLANTKILWNEPRLRQLRIDISPERLEVSRMITANAQTVSQGPAPSYERHFAPHLASFGDRDELQDARAPIHDSLVFKWTWPAWFPFGLAFLWWVLELLPMKQWTQDQDRKWHGNYRINLGRPRRAVPCTGEAPMFHISVLAKEQNQVEGRKEYVPRAKLPEGTVPLYVD